MTILPEYDRHFRNNELGNYQIKHFRIALGLVNLFSIERKIAIDVGGHVGHFAYNMVRYFDQVHTFEPVDDNYECLVKNLENFSNVNFFNFGLSCRNEEKEIFLEKDDNSGTWSIECIFSKNKNSCRKKIIKLHSFDELFPRLEPNYIKLDIQGHEPEALKGMFRTLMNSSPLVHIEVVGTKNVIEKLMNEIEYIEVFNFKKERYFVPKHLFDGKVKSENPEFIKKMNCNKLLEMADSIKPKNIL